MAYPETFATMTDLISQKLQDTDNATFTDAELLLYITEGLREIAQYHPLYASIKKSYQEMFSTKSRVC